MVALLVVMGVATFLSCGLGGPLAFVVLGIFAVGSWLFPNKDGRDE